MERIAFCGLDCGQCPAFLAHMQDDQELRGKTAQEWSRIYGSNIQSDDVNCTGCLGNGVQFPWCSTGCPIRICAMERHVSSCGVCSGYPCERVEFVTGHSQEARTRLDAISRSVEGAERQR